MSSDFSELCKPKYWLNWLGVGCLWLSSYLPYGLLIKLGKLVGRFLPYFSERQSKRVDFNLQLFFPQLSNEERAQLKKRNFESVGASIFEAALAIWGSDRRLRPLLHTIDRENYEKLKNAGENLLVMSPHFTHMHLVGRLITYLWPYAVMYNPHKNPVMDYFSRRALSCYERTIPRTSVKSLLRAVRDGVTVWIASDTNTGEKQYETVPFFGREVDAINSVARIVEVTKSKIVPVHFHRRDDGKGYNLEVLPAIDGIGNGDLAHDTAVITKVIEDGVAKHPEQYLWQYRRFKYQGERIRKL